MHQQKYFTLNFFINEIFSFEKFPNYGIREAVKPETINLSAHTHTQANKHISKHTNKQTHKQTHTHGNIHTNTQYYNGEYSEEESLLY